MTQTYLTAEHSINPRPGVWVMLETWSVQIDGALRPWEFVVRTSTGYRATLPACFRDECAAPNGPVRCVKEAGRQRRRTHCHSMHIEHAEAFAAKVGATYGSAAKAETSLTGLRRHPKRVRNVNAKAWADDPYAAALEGRTPHTT